MLAWIALALPVLPAFSDPVRLFVPASPMRSTFTQAANTLADEFNKTHPQSPLQIVWRGADFSSLNDLMVSAVSRETPELAIIEHGEALTPELGSIAQALPSAWRDELGVKELSKFALPFLSFQPVLAIDQEILFRLRLPVEPTVGRWGQLFDLADTVAKGVEGPRMGLPDYGALAMPLQGPRGVLLLESLFGDALDHPSSLAKELEAIRALFMRQASRGGLTFEQALQSFTTRRASLLVTTGDLQPHLKEEVYFRSRMTPVWNHETRGFGMALIATKTTEGVWEAVRFLFKNRGRLSEAAGAVKGPVPLARSVPWRLRARAEWQRVLPDLFGDANQRQPLDVILEALEHRLQKLQKS